MLFKNHTKMLLWKIINGKEFHCVTKPYEIALLLLALGFPSLKLTEGFNIFVLKDMEQ